MAAAWSASAYQCRTDVSLGPAVHTERKGIAVDDNTLRWCSSQIPERWPNADRPMTSIRLFKAWDPYWNDWDRAVAWANLESYVKTVGAKVFIGTQITCDEAGDEKAWGWTKSLIRRLGPQHLMGLAVGNELELLQFKGTDLVPQSCVERVWEQGYLWRRYQQFTAEFDSMGFSSVPVTSVFTGLGLAGADGRPFYEKPGRARVNSFLRNATQMHGGRFAFTWNFYPYFDSNFGLDEGTGNQCSKSLARAVCWGAQCNVPLLVREARTRQRRLTGSSSGTLWIGETGWSSPMSSTLETSMKHCEAWSSLQTFRSFYEGFLGWDMEIGQGLAPPDHVFWFTMRDSSNFGSGEHFGLISTCDDPKCKVHRDGYQPLKYALHDGPVQHYCGDHALYDGWAIGEQNCQSKCSLDARCQYYGVWPHSHDGHHWCRLTATCQQKASTVHWVRTYKKLEESKRTSTKTTTTMPAPTTAATTTAATTTRAAATTAAPTTTTVRSTRAATTLVASSTTRAPTQASTTQAPPATQAPTTRVSPTAVASTTQPQTTRPRSTATPMTPTTQSPTTRATPTAASTTWLQTTRPRSTAAPRPRDAVDAPTTQAPTTRPPAPRDPVEGPTTPSGTRAPGVAPSPTQGPTTQGPPGTQTPRTAAVTTTADAVTTTADATARPPSNTNAPTTAFPMTTQGPPGTQGPSTTALATTADATTRVASPTTTAVSFTTVSAQPTWPVGRCQFDLMPLFPGFFWDASCKPGMLGCNADGVNIQCRFCGGGSYSSIPCPHTSCTFMHEPFVPYYWDESCHAGMEGCWADGIHAQCRFCGKYPYTNISCPQAPAPPAARTRAPACTFDVLPATPFFVDPSCRHGMKGCLADAMHMSCRFCGEGDYADIPCPEGPTAQQCSFAVEPTTPYYWDPACHMGMLGCMADGVHPECRFCSQRPFEDIPCPEPYDPPEDRCEFPAGSGKPEMPRYWEPDCEVGVLGCWADGFHAECRFCGGEGVFRNITCPGTAATSGEPSTSREPSASASARSGHAERREVPGSEPVLVPHQQRDLPQQELRRRNASRQPGDSAMEEEQVVSGAARFASLGVGFAVACWSGGWAH